MECKATRRIEESDGAIEMTFKAFVPGSPQAQSGTVPLMHPKLNRIMQVTRGSKGLPGWRKAMTQLFALTWRHGVPMDNPLVAEYEFILPRLKSHPTTERGAIPKPHRSLDMDKLVRAVNDSLTKAEVIIDDSRICVFVASKRYAQIGETPGLNVTVSVIEETA